MAIVDIDNFPDSIREMLIKERDAVINRMDSIAKDALLVEFDGDGVPASSWGQDQALTDQLEGRLATIEDALTRLESGTYGVCADCNTDIPPRRLHALPFATLCVQCQSLADKRSRAFAH
jgi:RNA polymerase-binding transcription factor DksA